MRKTNQEKLYKLNPEDYSGILEPLRNCRICPRNCGADRFDGKPGWCKSDTSFFISSICIHRGEEPPISGEKGICNIFFGHCNLQCTYCQNHQISNNYDNLAARRMPFHQVLAEVIECIEAGCKGVGFVSPSHFIPQCKIIVTALNDLGYFPVVVYNTNGYDTVESLEGLENYVDVYLPDFKYTDSMLSKKHSQAANYPEIAQRALKEMYRQKGSSLLTDKENIAERGIIIRHLVLPGYVENSLRALDFIAEEISLSVHISIMSQYHPAHKAKYLPPINRTLYYEEYQRVLEHFDKLGFRNGFIQSLESNENYRPDFHKKHPFE
jgi:putative pyruvate formate lyase activating enzyme